MHNNAAPGSLAAGHPALGTTSQEGQILNAKLSDAERRLAMLDAQNRELTAKLPSPSKWCRPNVSRRRLIQQQLAEAAGKYKEVVAAKDDVERKASALYASQKQPGGATITANSSLRSSLKVTSVPGIEVRQEGTHHPHGHPGGQAVFAGHPATLAVRPGRARRSRRGHRRRTTPASSSSSKATPTTPRRWRPRRGEPPT